MCAKYIEKACILRIPMFFGMQVAHSDKIYLQEWSEMEDGKACFKNIIALEKESNYNEVSILLEF